MGRQSREKEERRQLARRVTDPAPPQQQQGTYNVRVEGISFRGPLPPPEVLQRYDQITPGLADRIVRMAEKNQDHRHNLENTVIPSRVKLEQRGQIIGALLGIAMIISGTAIVATGMPIVGVSIIGTTAVALAGLFVYTDRSKRKELEGKRPES